MFLSGCPKKLEKSIFQNVAAKISAERKAHVSPILLATYDEFREFQLLLLAYKALNSQATY